MIRVGHGFDLHRYEESSSPGVMLAGVKIPFELAVKAHSDGDVVMHALIDALLGALALGDIGQWFPDDSPENHNLDSLNMLLPVLDKVREQGFDIANLDITVIAQKPKLKDFILNMREHLAECCGLEMNQVSIKAKTHEKVDAIGEVKAIAAHAVVLLHA